MLQQTRVSAAKEHYTRFLARFPTIQALANASQSDVLAAWRGLGYYSRAKRLHHGARTLCHVDDVSQPHASGSAKGFDSPDGRDCCKSAQFGCPGRIPCAPAALCAIPGIGPYTAGAIASIAFGIAVPLVDTNVARVLARLLALHADVKDSRADALLWDVAGQLVARVAAEKEKGNGNVSDGDQALATGREKENISSAVPGRWNQALMDLGATVCTASGRPRCGVCPVRGWCGAFAEGVALLRDKDAATLSGGAREGIRLETTVESVDIEDVCVLCATLDAAAVEFTGLAGRRTVQKQATEPDSLSAASKRRKANRTSTPKHLSPFFAPSRHSGAARGKRPDSDSASSASPPASGQCKRKAATWSPSLAPGVHVETAVSDLEPAALHAVSAYCSLFPKRAVKKAVPERECIVCVVVDRQSKDGYCRALLEQRPDSGTSDIDVCIRAH